MHLVDLTQIIVRQMRAQNYVHTYQIGGQIYIMIFLQIETS